MRCCQFGSCNQCTQVTCGAEVVSSWCRMTRTIPGRKPHVVLEAGWSAEGREDPCPDVC